MKLLRGFGMWMLAGGVALAAVGMARAQSGQGSGSGGSSSGGSGSYSADQGGFGGGVAGDGRGGSTGSHSSISNLGSDVPQTQQQMEEQQSKLRNTERQKQLVADTQRLVELANELQADVSKSTKDTLSLDVVRKADEIDKLARNVRDRMKSAN